MTNPPDMSCKGHLKDFALTIVDTEDGLSPSNMDEVKTASNDLSTSSIQNHLEELNDNIRSFPSLDRLRPYEEKKEISTRNTDESDNDLLTMRRIDNKLPNYALPIRDTEEDESKITDNCEKRNPYRETINGINHALKITDTPVHEVPQLTMGDYCGEYYGKNNDSIQMGKDEESHQYFPFLPQPEYSVPIYVSTPGYINYPVYPIYPQYPDCMRSVGGMEKNTFDKMDIEPSTTTSLSKRQLCKLFIEEGVCNNVADNGHCDDAHGLLCATCKTYALHPFNDKERNEHKTNCEEKFEAKRKMATVISLSKEMQCMICLDLVWNKEAEKERRFGILNSCEHCFCLSCIRKWRMKGSGDVSRETARKCPLCRQSSDFVIPSKFWFETEEDRLKIIEDFREYAKTVDCRLFNRGFGRCKFGNKCFYLHRDPKGNIVELNSPAKRSNRRLFLGHNHYFFSNDSDYGRSTNDEMGIDYHLRLDDYSSDEDDDFSLDDDYPTRWSDASFSFDGSDDDLLADLLSNVNPYDIDID
ncbi:hypothetical protein SNEBB_005125 [Seison nebaliae]|nr:hypothetical protein SNEBB_005125 [Seison nebaliae]